MTNHEDDTQLSLLKDAQAQRDPAKKLRLIMFAVLAWDERVRNDTFGYEDIEGLVDEMIDLIRANGMEVRHIPKLIQNFEFDDNNKH